MHDDLKIFNERCGGDDCILKGPSHDKRKKIAEQTKTTAIKYAEAILQEIGLGNHEFEERIKLGPIKGDDETDRKAMSQYGGDRTQVDDNFRMQIFTTSPREMKKMIEVFCSPNFQSMNFHKHMQKARGIHHQKVPKDHVQYPKRWGWQGIIVKPQGQLSNGTKVPFEIQIMDKSMVDAYNWSHKEYEKVRTSLEKWEDSGKNIHDVLTKGEIKIVEGMLKRHEQDGRKAGLDVFWQVEFPEIGDPPAILKEDDVKHIEDIPSYARQYTYDDTLDNFKPESFD